MSNRPDIDLLAGSFWGGDHLSAFAWMRENDPVYRDEKSGVWAITRYRDLKDVEKDPATFSNGGGIRPDSGPLPMMIDMDAPDHVQRRRLVSSGFTPRHIRELEGHVTATCDRLIDDVIEGGECEFVGDVAAWLPLILIGEMMGMDESMRHDLLVWSDDLVKGQGSTDPALIEGATVAFIAWDGFIRGVIEDRRSSGSRQDLVGILAHAEVDDMKLTDDEIVYESLLILIGGDETSRHVITGGLEALLHNPDAMLALRRDPSAMPLAVEEMLRWVSPLKNMARTVTRDVEFGGKTLREGEKLILCFPSANRDAAQFAEPDRFDITRSPNDHVAFGFGPHFCLGNQLARMELRCMFTRLIERMDDIALASDAPLLRRPANFVSGIEAMPITFTPGTKLGN